MSNKETKEATTMSKFNLHAFADEAGQNMNEQIAALRENGYEGLEIRKIED